MDHNNFRRPNVHRHSLYDTLSVRVCMCVCEMQLNIWLAYIWNASCEIYFSLMVTLLEHITWYLRRFRCASYLLYSLNSEKINVNRDVSALSVRGEEWIRRKEKKLRPLYSNNNIQFTENTIKCTRNRNRMTTRTSENMYLLENQQAFYGPVSFYHPPLCHLFILFISLKSHFTGCVRWSTNEIK